MVRQLETEQRRLETGGREVMGANRRSPTSIPPKRHSLRVHFGRSSQPQSSRCPQSFAPEVLRTCVVLHDYGRDFVLTPPPSETSSFHSMLAVRFRATQAWLSPRQAIFALFHLTEVERSAEYTEPLMSQWIDLGQSGLMAKHEAQQDR